MSGADEILKLKELLDEGILTEEEFKIKKNLLLNEEIVKEKNNQDNNNNNTNKPKRKKSPIKYIIIGFIIFCMFLAVAISSAPTIEKQLQDITGVTQEQALKIKDVLSNCGYTNYEIVRDEEMDDYWGKGTTAFQIKDEHTTNGISLSGFTIKNDKIHNVYYMKNELYKNGKVLHKISYFFLTDDEKYDYIDFSKEEVKKKLNYPNTAKFPLLYNEYSVSYKDRSKVVVKGTVTVSNAFNVSTTYTFEVTFKDNQVTKVNLY